MKKVIVFGGSNSKKSINKALAIYASQFLKDINCDILDLNDFDLPLFGVDLEESVGFPKDALKFNELLEGTDGIILSLAENNGSYSTAFKNLFDWLSRIEGKVWRNKPMLLLSTSPGARGGITVLEAAKSRFPYMGGNIIESMSLPSFYENFKEGKIIDEELNHKLRLKVQTFEKQLLNSL